jgi:hypothetical protein
MQNFVCAVVAPSESNGQRTIFGLDVRNQLVATVPISLSCDAPTKVFKEPIICPILMSIIPRNRRRAKVKEAP